MAAKSMVPGDGPGLSKETKLKRQCGKPQQLRSKAFQGERNTCDSKGNLWAFGVIGWSAYPRFDSGQKPRQFKSIWIWANRPSSKGSKLLFPVIKANKIIGSRMTIGGQTHFHALGAHTKSLVPGWRSVDKLTFIPTHSPLTLQLFLDFCVFTLKKFPGVTPCKMWLTWNL